MKLRGLGEGGARACAASLSAHTKQRQLQGCLSQGEFTSWTSGPASAPLPDIIYQPSRPAFICLPRTSSLLRQTPARISMLLGHSFYSSQPPPPPPPALIFPCRLRVFRLSQQSPNETESFDFQQTWTRCFIWIASSIGASSPPLVTSGQSQSAQGAAIWSIFLVSANAKTLFSKQTSFSSGALLPLLLQTSSSVYCFSPLCCRQK